MVSVSKSVKTAIFILIISFPYTAFVNAQSTQGNITKQDALDFINEVARKFNPAPGANFGVDNSDYVHNVTLNGCILTIASSYILKTSYKDSYMTDTLQIDLSSVYFQHSSDPNLDSNIRANTVGSITTINASRWRKKDGSVNMRKYDDKYTGHQVNYISGGDWDQTQVLVGAMGNSEQKDFLELDTYAARLKKALNFLVIACGGGKAPESPSSVGGKF